MNIYQKSINRLCEHIKDLVGFENFNESQCKDDLDMLQELIDNYQKIKEERDNLVIQLNDARCCNSNMYEMIKKGTTVNYGK